MLSAGFLGRPLRPSLVLDFLNSTSLDPRITFTRASSATYFDAAGVMQIAGSGVARFDHDPVTLARRGLMIEEGRTNLVANNTSTGAVAGSPGTAPTGWSVSGSNNGITQTVVGTGTENGIAYVDFRYQGTATGALFNGFILFGGSTAFAAAPGDVRTLSSYLRLMAGSWAGVSSPSLSLSWYTSGQAYITGAGTAISAVTGAALATQRKTYTGTAPANTAYVRPAVNWTVASGTTVDFTLRIGLPQVEAGGFVTSPILTSSGAATRAADVATILTGAFPFNPAAGTVAAYFEMPANTGDRYVWKLDDTTISNRLQYWRPNGAAGNNTSIVVSGVTTADTANTVTIGAARTATAYAPSDQVTAANGTLGTPSTGAIPTGLSILRIGSFGGGNGQLNGWIGSLTYYPRRLSNAELQRVTA